MVPSTSDSPSSDSSRSWQWDEVFLHARREAWGILAFWAVALVWCVPVCYVLGYERPGRPADPSLVWGIPAWLFWGVVVPWVVAIGATIWFCFGVMKEDRLEVDDERREEDDVAEAHEESHG